MHFRTTLSGLWSNIQQQLFPLIESHVGELSSQYKRLTSILELLKIEESLPCTRFNFGRPCHDRPFIARAYIAKIVLKIPYTKQLVQILKRDKQLRVICGWDATSMIPSESKFSRAFKEFAEASLPEKVHKQLVSKVFEDKIIGHLVKDSTPICARERAVKKQGTRQQRKKSTNERYLKEKKGEVLSRRKKQLTQDVEEAIKELPRVCDIGCKKGSQGYILGWKGYKLHVAASDDCIPVSAILTSASLNDCEAAIPLANKAQQVAVNLYDLMDSAYDVPEVKEHSISLGHVPIIDQNPRGKVKKAEKEAEEKRKKILNFSTAEDRRYKQRFSKERFNALFKDYYGGRNIFYKGYTKIFCHIMFGITALTASMILDFL